MLKIFKQTNGKFSIKCILPNPKTKTREQVFSGENIDAKMLQKFLDRSGIPKTDATFAYWKLVYMSQIVVFTDDNKLEGGVTEQ